MSQGYTKHILDVLKNNKNSVMIRIGFITRVKHNNDKN